MKKAFLFLTILTVASTSTPAATIFSDDFGSYSDGALAGQGPWTTVSGGIGEMVDNHQVLIATSPSVGANDQTRATFPGSRVYGGTTNSYIYTKFTLMVTNVPGPPGSTTPGTYFACLSDSGSVNLRSRIFLMSTNFQTLTAASAGNFFIAIGNSSRSAQAPPPGLDQAPVAWSTELTTNVLYTVVTRYIASNALSTLWINPTAEGDTHVDAQDVVTNIPATLDNGPLGFNFRRSTASGGVGALHVSGLVVGLAFNDVAGANTAPLISSIDSQNIPASSSTGPLDFTVQDAETPAASLNVSATSTNTALIPNNGANLTLGGSGTNRTINVTPVAGQQGQSEIKVTVSDGVNSSFSTFLVRVGAPVISAIPDQTTYTNVPIPSIPFTIGDAESDTLTLSGASSNPTLLTSGNIVFGGSGSNRTVTLTPQAGQIGLTTVTISVGDGHTTNTSSFSLTVSPYLGLLFAEDFNYTSFTQPNALYGATGSPWQTIPPGIAYELQVTNPLAYLNHTNTEDLGAALTNPPYFPSNAVIFYTKFDVNFSFLPSNLGEYFLHLKSSDIDNQNFRCKIFAQTTNAASGKFRLGISTIAAAASAQLPVDLDLDTTYTVVTRYNSATSASTLWVNPASESSQSATADELPNTGTIGGIGLREGNFMGDMTIAALRVGTKFTDVVTTVAPIPLGITRSGGNIILTWSNPAFALTSATSVGGPYTTINGATSPYTNAISGGQQYFRLQH